MEHLAAAEARGESVELIYDFFKFCRREPDVAVLIALLGGVIGQGLPSKRASVESEKKEDGLPN